MRRKPDYVVPGQRWRMPSGRAIVVTKLTYGGEYVSSVYEDNGEGLSMRHDTLWKLGEFLDSAGYD